MTLSHNRTLTPSWARSLVSDPDRAHACHMDRDEREKLCKAWEILMHQRGRACNFRNIQGLETYNLPKSRIDMLFGGPGDAA